MAISPIWRVNLQDWMTWPEMMSNNKDTLENSKNTPKRPAITGQIVDAWTKILFLVVPGCFYHRLLLMLVGVLFAHVRPRNAGWLVRTPCCPSCQVRVDSNKSATSPPPPLGPWSHRKCQLTASSRSSCSTAVWAGRTRTRKHVGKNVRIYAKWNTRQNIRIDVSWWGSLGNLCNNTWQLVIRKGHRQLS